MPETATETLDDDELDLSPEVLTLLMRRRYATAALASPGNGHDGDRRHRRAPTPGHRAPV